MGSTVLYHNNRDGTFTDVTAAAGVDDSRWSTSAAFSTTTATAVSISSWSTTSRSRSGRNKACYDHDGAGTFAALRLRAAPSRFFRNDGGLRFTDVTEASGIARAYGAGLGVATGDFDGDGWPDIYVANDATPNQLWINRHDGTFEDRGVISGTAFNAGGRPEGSMGIAAGDFDNDGDEDLFVTNIAGESHALYVNDGHANFEDVRTRAGLSAPTAGMTGFGTGWLDYDHDGRLDLFVANGAVNILERERGEVFPYRQHNQLFHNEGARFRDATAEAGPAFTPLEVGRGVAFGDIDNDGDVDVLVTNNNGPVRLLLNGTNVAGRTTGPSGETPMHWVEIALRADAGNRFGLGARVGVVRTGQPTEWRRCRTDGSYLSASDSRVHFGLGASARIDAVTVDWPDGVRESFSGVQADHLVTLRRGSGRPGPETR